VHGACVGQRVGNAGRGRSGRLGVVQHEHGGTGAAGVKTPLRVRLSALRKKYAGGGRISS